jgi:hypothetical protein
MKTRLGKEFPEGPFLLTPENTHVMKIIDSPIFRQTRTPGGPAGAIHELPLLLSQSWIRNSFLSRIGKEGGRG